MSTVCTLGQEYQTFFRSLTPVDDDVERRSICHSGVNKHLMSFHARYSMNTDM